MLQSDTPEDLVIAAGVAARVKDFLDVSFGNLDLDWNKFVEIDDSYKRPTEVDSLIGDPAEAKNKLGWEPGVRFDELARIMAKRDFEVIANPEVGRERIIWRH